MRNQRVVRRQHVDTQVVHSLVEFFVLLVALRFVVNPHCDDFVISMHLLHKLRSNVWQLEVAAVALVVGRGYQFDGALQGAINFKTLQVDGTDLGALVELCRVQMLKLSYGLVIETLDHAVLCQVILLD